MKLFPTIKPAAFCLALLIAVLLLTQSPLFGQATGNVTGTVADTTGAVIPNATVVLTNTTNGTTRQTTSNGSGVFAFSAVTSSTAYTIKISMPSFKAWQSQPFAVRPGDAINFSDIKLEIGTATLEVTVESTADSIKVMTSGEKGDVITANEIKTLAVVGRDATELVRMMPGFAMSSGDQGVNNKAGYNSAVVGLSGPTGSFSANGSGTNGISVVTDGASLTDIFSGSGTTQNVNIDMVSEVKVSTSSYGADNAKGPVIVNAIGKSGTSSFHGLGYFYARDTTLNANDWYDNHFQQQRPDGRYLYPGAQLGGPLYIPGTKLNKNKDKLFFFVGYEYYNQNFGGGTLGSWVPTLAMRQGDFSKSSLDAQLCGARPDGIQNPNALKQMCQTMNFNSDGTVLNNGDLRQFANASGVALVNWFPLPNANPFTNVNGYNYIQQVQQQQNGSQFNSRLDYSINDNNKLFLTYKRQNQIAEVPVNWGGYTPAASMLYPGNVTSGDLSHVFALNYTRVISARMTNELSAAMALVSSPGSMGSPSAVSRFSIADYNCQDPVKRAAGTCGSDGYGNFNYLGQFKNAGDYSLPSFSDYNGSLGYPQTLMPGGFYDNKVRMKKVVPNVSDIFSVVQGTHFFKAGFYAETGIVNGLAQNAYPQGQIGFDAGSTMWGTWNPIAREAQWTGCHSSDPAGQQRLGGAAYLGNCVNPVGLMYSGYASSWSQSNFSPVVNMQYKTFSGFLTDQWKVTRRLTLDIGARFEHMGPWSDRHGNGVAVFDPALYAEQCPEDPAHPGHRRLCGDNLLPGVTWHGVNKSTPLGGVQLSTLYFSPRIGAAWDVFGNGETVIRGGGGAYRSQEEFAPYAQAAASATGYKNSYLTNNYNALTLDMIDSHSPGGQDVADFDISVINPKDKTRPIYWEYNLTVNQKMPWRSNLELSYVGSDNKNLSSGNTSPGDLNFMPFGTLFTAPITTTPIYAGDSVSDIGSMTTSQIDYWRTYSFYRHIYQVQHNFYSKYNSLQASWNRNVGFVQFGVNYTFSKNLAVLSSYGNTLPDPVNLRNDYNPVPYDRTHILNAHYLIDLGTRIHGNKILGHMLNNWQISGISSLQSGPPMASLQGLNLGFNYGQLYPTATDGFHNQVNSGNAGDGGICKRTLGSSQCITSISNSVWLGTPDIQLMPTVLCDPATNLGKNQYINVNCFGIPNLYENGVYRLPYIHGPAYMNHDLSVLKNFKMGEKRSLQLRLAAFNFLNHPLTSFDKNDTNNLNLGNFQNAVVGQSIGQYMSYPYFGVAQVKYGSRLMELSIKYEF
jgi:Carboxypeptidase regulatory-like domain